MEGQVDKTKEQGYTKYNVIITLREKFLYVNEGILN